MGGTAEASLKQKRASAMRNNPSLPNKDEFMQKLNTKLQARLSAQFGQTKQSGH
jgi:hypothetical protein